MQVHLAHVAEAKQRASPAWKAADRAALNCLSPGQGMFTSDREYR